MNERKATAKFLCLLVCILALAGCDRHDKERDEAIAKAEQARVETALEELQDERDELKETLGIISENWEKANSELTVATQAHNDLLNQVNELTNEKDSAIDQSKAAEEQIERLNEQLQEKTEENQKLQATTEDLEAQIKELSEHLVEQSEDEEVADGNNV